MINEKLKRLEENLRVLGRFKDCNTLLKMSLQDKVDEWALRYGLTRVFTNNY